MSPQWVVYPLAADNVSRPFVSRLKSVYQRVVRARIRFSAPHARLRALAERVAPTSYRRYALPNVQVEPLDKGRIDRPPAGSQGLLDRLTRLEHHPMLDIDWAPAPV